MSIIILCAAALFIINPLKMLADRNDKIRVYDLQTVSQALEKYHLDYGRYPDSIPWGTEWNPYMSLVPKDPGFNRKYVYISSSEGNFQSFRLYASLEDPAVEKNACSVTGQCPNVSTNNLCEERTWPVDVQAPCNFGVTSSNISP